MNQTMPSNLSPVESILLQGTTLIVQNTFEGVVITHIGPLGEHSNDASFVARAMLAFTEGLWAGGRSVILAKPTLQELNT